MDGQGIERFAAVVAFDDVGHNELGHFEGGETLAAREAFAATTHLAALAG